MTRLREPAAWEHAKTVAARALDGYVMHEVGDATSFHAARLGSAPDGHMARVAQVGGHVFLVNARRGSASAGGMPKEKTAPGPTPAEASTPTVLAAS